MATRSATKRRIDEEARGGAVASPDVDLALDVDDDDKNNDNNNDDANDNDALDVDDDDDNNNDAAVDLDARPAAVASSSGHKAPERVDVDDDNDDDDDDDDDPLGHSAHATAGDNNDDNDDDDADDDDDEEDDDDEDDEEEDDGEPSLANLKLPLFDKIMAYLPLKDVLSVGEASHALRVRAASNSLWLAMIERSSCSRCLRCFRWALTVDEVHTPTDAEQFYKQFFAIKYLRCIDVGERRIYMAKTMSKRCIFCSERAA